MILPGWIKSITHAGTVDYLSNPYPKLGEKIEIKLHIAAMAPVQKIVLRTCPNGEQQFTAMQKAEVKGNTQIWISELKINEPMVPYRFGILTKKAIYWFNASGISQQEPFSMFDFKILADFHPISWLRNAVFYQIFPDRFANGDQSNDPIMQKLGFKDLTRTTYGWGQPAPKGEKNMLAFYGGDLQGVIQKLNHLQILGVNAIYLNPIFTAFSNHRYDVTDYEHVDPVLGGDEALIALKKKLNNLKMHLILDIVPNHCGYGHPWFQKALQDPKSTEANFFYFDKHPDQYESWMGHNLLPKFNYASKELRIRMYLASDSVFKRWLNPPFSADGWRVDVANMLGRRNGEQHDRQLLPEIRNAVKEISSDTYLIGENFYEAASQLQGDGWDGVMNYAGFCTPLLYWLTDYQLDALGWSDTFGTAEPWSTEILVKTWQDHLAAIPWQIALQQFNVLDSHDTPRIKTMLNGNDNLHRLAIVLQFTFPGVPCVYYGDEIGLMDEEEFGSRNCMQWDQSKWNQSLFTFYKSLIEFRKNSDILKEGSFQVLYFNEDVLVFQRYLQKRHIIITANRSNKMKKCDEISFDCNHLAEKIKLNSLLQNQSAQICNNKLLLPDLTQGADIWVAE